MSRTYIETCGSKLVYDTDIDVYDYLLKNQNFIELPSLNISREDNGTQYLLRYRDAQEKHINCTENGIYIEYPKNIINAESIVYPATSLLEKQHHDYNSLTCHSACVEKDGKAILLLGKTGSGKTTTAINLCLKHGYKLIGNDRTVLHLDDTIEALGGTKFLFLRYESIKRNLPQLLSVFEQRQVDKNYNSSRSKIDSWNKKIRVLPSELGIDVVTGNIPIEKAYVLHVDESQHEVVARNGNYLANRLLLWDNFNTIIRSVETTFRDKDYREIGYIPSYDSEKYYDFKTKMVDVILNELGMEYLSGNIDDVSQTISQHQKRLKR